MHIQPLIQHTVFDNAIPLLRSHRARPEAVPCSLHMSLDPFLDMLDVLLAIFQILVYGFLMCVQERRLRWFPAFDGHAPASVLDARGDVSGQCVCIRGCKVHVLGARRRGIVVEGMHTLDFASISVHPAGCFTRLDVAPYHGRHITLVVHESGVKIGRFIGVCGHDVGGAAGEWVFLYSKSKVSSLNQRKARIKFLNQDFQLKYPSGTRAYRSIENQNTHQKVEHSKEFARRHQHMITEPSVYRLGVMQIRAKGMQYPAMTE
jgi:hypothetical protein